MGYAPTPNSFGGSDLVVYRHFVTFVIIPKAAVNKWIRYCLFTELRGGPLISRTLQGNESRMVKGARMEIMVILVIFSILKVRLV